ncbi:MAG: hypothetical protein ACBR50_11930 [Microcoleus sp.]
MKPFFLSFKLSKAVNSWVAGCLTEAIALGVDAGRAIDQPKT